jgi:cob(I)alamin adenosyltransferase
MSVYTKFGDKGKTSLYGGKTVSKADVRVEAYGAIDELNSFLGIAIAFLKDKSLKQKLILLQNDLFEIGTSLASLSKNNDKKLSLHLSKRVKEFEKEIDFLTKKLPELENFILPGGSKSASQIHFARTLVRKAERRIVRLSQSENVNPEILIFINRLSDLLFMWARYINKKEKKKEILWKSRE